MSNSIKFGRAANILLSIALIFFFYCPRAVLIPAITTNNGYRIPSEIRTFSWWAGIWGFLAIGCMVIVCLLSLTKYYRFSYIGTAVILFCVGLPTFTIESSNVRVLEDFVFYANLLVAILLFANSIFLLRSNRQQAPAKSTTSATDELKKYNELLASGVITQEEFDAKKKQLLDL